MKRRNFIKLLGAGYAIVAIPILPTFETSIYQHPEVKAVLSKFPEPLLYQEKKAIADFTMDGVKSGYWQKIDDHYAFWLQNEKNALTNWK